MKLITRDTDYAVRAVCYIAKKGKQASVDELIAETKIPRAFLRKILQQLNKAKLLKSYKGRGGGFSLLRKTKNIYIKDIMKVFQGPLSLNECIFKKQVCPDIKKCPLRKKVTNIEKYVLSEINNITIDSLLKTS